MKGTLWVRLADAVLISLPLWIYLSTRDLSTTLWFVPVALSTPLVRLYWKYGPPSKAAL